MIHRMTLAVAVIGAFVGRGIEVVHAQDVPGIEICTVEKTMERRTSCLQSNVNFLQTTIGKLSLDSQKKLDAANRQIDALKASLVSLQKTVDDLRAAQKASAVAPAKDTSKDAPAKSAPAAPAAKEGTK